MPRSAAAHAQDVSRLGTLGDFEADCAVQSLYIHTTAQDRMGYFYWETHDDIVSLPAESRMREYMDFNIQIARGSACGRGIPLARHLQDLAVADAARDEDFKNFFFFGYSPACAFATVL